MNRAPFVVSSVAFLAAFACSPPRNGAIHASGHVEATEIRLAATVGGRLLEAPFQEGDPVTLGAVVARLDTQGAQHDLARARAQIGAADAQLRLLLSGTRAEDLRRADEQLALAKTEHDAAARDVARLEPLAERGTASEKALDDATTRRDVARRRVDALRAERDKLVAGPRRQEIEAARAQRAMAEAVAAAVEQRITDATVLAPRGGILTTRVAEVGEVLGPGAPIAVLTDLAHPWLQVYVDEPSLAWIRLGDDVEVRVDGLERGFVGRVSHIASVAEFTPKNVQTPEERAKLVFRVKIALDNDAGIFKPGMPADAYFETNHPPAQSPVDSSRSTVDSSQSIVQGLRQATTAPPGSRGTV